MTLESSRLINRIELSSVELPDMLNGYFCLKPGVKPKSAPVLLQRRQPQYSEIRGKTLDTELIKDVSMRPGRNDPCSCGSGRKYKNCCGGKAGSLPQAPSPAETDPLIALYNAGHFAELERRTRLLVDKFPDFGFGWKLLGGALQMQGKNALFAFQRVVELMPGDAEAHFNLGVIQKSVGQLNDAVASYRLSLKLNPDSAEAHSNLGNALQDLGQLDDALASFRRALKIKPDSAAAHNSLGTVLKNLGKIDDAVDSYSRAVAIKPNYAEALYNLGNAQKNLGQLDNAAASYRRAMEIKPDFADAFYNLGIALQGLGQLDDAVTSYRRLLMIKPDFAGAYNNLGIALKDLGHVEDAVANLRCALKFEPDSVAVLNNLGTALEILGEYGAAVASYRRALEIKPDCAEVHINLGNALKDLGQLDEAWASYRLALEINPECDEAMLGIGQLCEINGDMKEAEDAYMKALEIKPNRLVGRLMLASVRKTKAGDENLTALLGIENAAKHSKSPMPYIKAVPLHFALGKCFDDLGDYDQAFQHYIKGCKVKRATLRYDAEQMTQKFSGIMRVFDLEMIDRLRGGGDPSRLPIFVVGMPRSGTTLTEQIIASHPEVYGAGELRDLMAIAQRDVAGTGAVFPHNVSALDQAGLGAWGTDYVAGLQRRARDARYVTDKMPANFFAIGLIHMMLPNAKIIHVNRNPLDTCLSCFTQLFTSKQEHTYDLAELGRYYVDYARLMEHWRSVLPDGAFLDVQYEDIVADQETQARRMIDFCGLDWDDACIEFHKNKRSILTASVNQVRQPIYKSSVERWRRHEKYLGPLLDALGDLALKKGWEK